MAIRCPRCAREYDVTLFQFGRTVDCACGERVGLTLEVRLPDDADEPRFLCDAMLGRLGRWLRALGYDAEDAGADRDGALVRRAVRERRLLLTRDRKLARAWRVDVVVLVAGQTPAQQLRDAVERFGLDCRARLFTRCMLCNVALEPTRAEEVADRIPPGVPDTQPALARCPSCGRVYWEGQHTVRMRRWLARHLGGGDVSGPEGY